MGFKDPLEVSSGPKWDSIRMRIKNPKMFVSKKTGIPLDISAGALQSTIPPQLPKGVDAKKLAQ